jgi:hypothetical protein
MELMPSGDFGFADGWMTASGKDNAYRTARRRMMQTEH